MNRSEAGKLGALKTKETWMRRYHASPKFCTFCDSKLSYEKRHNKFCDHSCSASFSNASRSKAKKSCVRCEKPVQSWRKYCSHKCHKKHVYDVWIERWLAGEEDGTVFGGMSISNHIRKWLVDQFGECCSSCGWNQISQFTNKIPLHVDHIDGNSENNRPENLRLLCPNCHSLTPHFGNLNRGNGRSYRRKLRQEKKEIYL